MSNLIQGFLNIFRFHKLKILAAVFAFVGFLILLFPFDDVSDLVTAQVAKATQNQVFLQFKDPGISFFPQLGFKLEDVYVETQVAPPLKADKLSIAPSVAALLAFKTGVSVYAENLLGGDISASLRSSKMKDSTKDGQTIPAHYFSIDAEDIDIAQISKLGGLPIQLKGKLELDSDGDIDATFKEQPAINIKIRGKTVSLPPDTVPTPMGPFTLPDLRFANLEIDGELKNGKLLITRGVIGGANDDLNGTIKGSIDMIVSNMGGKPMVSPGGYDVQLNLNVRDSLQKKIGLFFILCDSMKKTNGNFVNYPCGLSSTNMMMPPKARAL